MKRSVLWIVLSLALATGCRSANEGCEPAGGITPICGFLAPEDLEVTGAGDAIIVGGFSLDNANGDIRALYLADEAAEIIYAPDRGGDSVPAEARWGDPTCEGPSDSFAAHGIHLSQNEFGTETLLVVNHTGRESIEWFEVSRDTAGRYAAEWKGCVIIDEELWVNDVAMLPEGGFVASHMMPRELASTLFDRKPNDDVETGYLVTWKPGDGWQKIEGTEGALPNGVQVSPDGSVIYNNHYSGDQTIAFDRVRGRRIWTTEVPGAPDNMSITPAGKLLIAAHLATLREIRDCMNEAGPFCALGFALFYLDPADGGLTPVFESAGPPFGGSTVAVETGGSIYMGAFAGNRIGRIAAP